MSLPKTELPLPLLHQLELWLMDADPSHFWGDDGYCLSCRVHLSYPRRNRICRDPYRTAYDEIDAMKLRLRSLRLSMRAIKQRY